MAETFTNLGIGEVLTERLNKISITEPTNVQAKVIPAILEGKSIIFQSETGTGKTLAYLLPLVQNLSKAEHEKKQIRLLIVSPTIELASQIKAQLQSISDEKPALLVGGAPIKRQIDILKEKPTIAIGGAARLLELFHLKKLRLDGTECLVLDEVDRLLSPELRDETVELITALKKDVQIVANSATIAKSTEKILGETVSSKLETIFLPPEDILRKGITHIALFSERRDKIETLRKLLHAINGEKVLIFTSKIDQVANITSKLKYKNLDCAGLHAKTDKVSRKQTIDKFRSGKLKVLVTSDLASRGLDIPDVSYIVQMDFPSNEDFFIHRTGRTARAGKTGFNVVIGDEYELRKYASLEKKLKITVYPKQIYNGKLISPEQIEENENI